MTARLGELVNAVRLSRFIFRVNHKSWRWENGRDRCRIKRRTTTWRNNVTCLVTTNSGVEVGADFGMNAFKDGMNALHSLRCR